MKENVLVLHGWGSSHEVMRKSLNPVLKDHFECHYVQYDSDNDQARLKDFTETLNRLLTSNGLLHSSNPLNVVAHSTGALIFRRWLRDDDIPKIGNVVLLAPANFGSPLAESGRSLASRIVVGAGKRLWRGERLENLFETGKEILLDLEPGSMTQWELATDHDVFKKDKLDASGRTRIQYKPVSDKRQGLRISVFVGGRPYKDLMKSVPHFLAGRPKGTDGTIVVAGANLDVELAWIDYDQQEGPKLNRTCATIDPPFALHAKHDHSSIHNKLVEDEVLRDQFIRALKGSTPYEYDEMRKEFHDFTENQTDVPQFLQLVFRVVDQHEVATPGVTFQFKVQKQGDGDAARSRKLQRLLNESEHVANRTMHLRRYLVPLSELKQVLDGDYDVALQLTAKSGDAKIKYAEAPVLLYDHQGGGIDLFRAHRTTLVDVHLERENSLVRWGNQSEGRAATGAGT